MANPQVAEQKTSKLNIVVAGTEKGIVMVESRGPSKVSEDKVAEALEFGHEQIKKIRGGDQAVARTDQADQDRDRTVPV